MLEIAKYRKKPVIIEAVQWKGDNLDEIVDLVRNSPTDRAVVLDPDDNNCLLISTLEGEMRANKGDYIIKGIQNEVYPCKPDIFKASYEIVDGEKEYGKEKNNIKHIFIEKKKIKQYYFSESWCKVTYFQRDGDPIKIFETSQISKELKVGDKMLINGKSYRIKEVTFDIANDCKVFFVQRSNCVLPVVEEDLNSKIKALEDEVQYWKNVCVKKIIDNFIKRKRFFLF